MDEKLKNKKIILVEDDDLIRDLFKNHLHLAGFNIDAFATGKDAMTALKNHQYDLLLLDIMLPDSNGLEILKAVKHDPKTKKLMVVLLTNLGQDTVIDQAYKEGAAGYLIKLAYNPDQIVEEVKRFLSAEN